MTGDERFLACTIVARNYLAQAEVLAESFIRFHPDIEFVTLVIDGTDADRNHPGVGRVMLPSELGLEPSVVNGMSVIYDVMEYATALKPGLLMALVRENASAVAYIDPDIRFYAPIYDVFEDAAEGGIFLTPHVLHPMPRDGKNHTEAVIMNAGMFNLGFIAVSASAYRFLNWWHERLLTDAIVDIANELFTDQRWVDWAPSVFRTVITQDPGLNVAYWNLHERVVSKRGDDFYIDDSRLRFFHFSGFEPTTPWVLSKHLGDRPRALISDSAALKEVVADYAQALNDAGHFTRRRSPYGLSELPGGGQLTHWLRRSIRCLVLGDVTTVTPMPDPIADSERFLDWFVDPESVSHRSVFSPLDLAARAVRPDLMGAYPDLVGSSRAGYLWWLENDADYAQLRASIGRPASAGSAPHPAHALDIPPRHAYGWSAIAYATSELGVGEAGRRVGAAMRRAGVPTELVAVTGGTESRQLHPAGQVKTSVSYQNAVMCVNADQTPQVMNLMHLNQLRGRRVGYWFWELEQFPKRFQSALDVVHEVWVASEFTRAGVQAETAKPVRLVPLAIDVPTIPTAFTRRSLGLPENKFIFLTNFDYFSVVDRKNPIAVIRAYCAAFGPDDGATLIVKSINGDRRILDRERVRLESGDRADILFFDDYVTATEMRAMIELSDCLVSLHRSEGYGLNLADAMGVGTPTIATGYSGNMEFMSEDTAFLVPYELTEVGPFAAPYDADAVWAQPSESRATELMRTVFDHPDLGRSVAERARVDLATRFSLDAVAAIAREAMLPMMAEASA